VGFESIGEESGDEFQYSDIIARHYGTEHHKIHVDSGAKLLPSLPGCIQAMAEPMVSHDAIGFYLLSQEVAKHVKVVQSGQGADEVFAGYHWYPPMLESRDPAADYAEVFCDRSHQEYLHAVHPRLHPRLKGEDYSRAFIHAHFARAGAESGVDKALRIDQLIMLVDDPVKRVDNMTMAWGLEARVPFLDHELVELAARIPQRHKLCDDGKGVLKAVGRRVIPSEVIDRPKGYFPVPALKYLRGEVLTMVRDTVLSRRAQERALFQRSYVDELLSDPETHITPLRGSKLWQVALLELWLQQQGV
jgi:asparagine synthase (glutamine-hydrolysing)